MSWLNGGPLDDPISLLMIQMLIILTMPRVLNAGLKYLHQPLVVSEILSGIVLGPSVLGKIPGFSQNIFPKSSLPSLNAISQLGLVLYLFMVGLNIDISKVKQQWRKSAVACAFAALLPFIGAIPVGFILHKGQYTPASLGVLIGFLGLAFYNSAIAVLARILAENDLLESNLGTICISSAAIELVVAWILLAIILASNATSEASSGVSYLNPLWVIMLTFGQLLLLYFVVRKFMWQLCENTKKTGLLTPLNFITYLLIVFCFSWFTDQTGISAMFGAFEVGVLVPRKGPTVQLIKEKLEDLTVGILLPVFFTFSGLRTDLSLLNTGETIGYTLLIIIIASGCKFFAVVAASRICHLCWDESFAFGILMTCKGLVALAMFNIGVDNNIITPRLFTMLVVYCVVATFIVTPVTTLLIKRKEKVRTEGRGSFNVLVCPQIPKLSPPIISLANALTRGKKQKQISLIRFYKYSDRLSDELVDTKPKRDHILGPAIQRANFFKIKLTVKSVVTENETEELKKYLSDENIQIVIFGYDRTDSTKELIISSIRAGVSDVAVQCGEDLGEITKILVVISNTTNDLAVYDMAINILNSDKPAVTVLNLSTSENESLKQFEESTSKISGRKIAVVQGVSDDPTDSILSILNGSLFSLAICGFTVNEKQASELSILEKVAVSTTTPFVYVHSKSNIMTFVLD